MGILRKLIQWREKSDGTLEGPALSTDVALHRTVLDTDFEVPEDYGTVIANELSGDGELTGDGDVVVVPENVASADQLITSFGASDGDDGQILETDGEVASWTDIDLPDEEDDNAWEYDHATAVDEDEETDLDLDLTIDPDGYDIYEINLRIVRHDSFTPIKMRLRGSDGTRYEYAMASAEGETESYSDMGAFELIERSDSSPDGSYWSGTIRYDSPNSDPVITHGDGTGNNYTDMALTRGRFSNGFDDIEQIEIFTDGDEGHTGYVAIDARRAL